MKSVYKSVFFPIRKTNATQTLRNRKLKYPKVETLNFKDEGWLEVTCAAPMVTISQVSTWLHPSTPCLLLSSCPSTSFPLFYIFHHYPLMSSFRLPVPLSPLHPLLASLVSSPGTSVTWFLSLCLLSLNLCSRFFSPFLLPFPSSTLMAERGEGVEEGSGVASD